MRKYFNNTWFMYSIIFAFGFMLFLYEPVMMYLGQQAEFSFGINMILKSSLFLLAITFFSLTIIYNSFYFFAKKKFLNFENLTIVLFIVFICSYIQGNYLAGNLPLLDGRKIKWGDYTSDNIITIIIWIVIIITVIFLCKKFKKDRMLKIFGYVSLAVVLMLTSSLVTTLVQSDGIKKNDFIIKATSKNLGSYSQDKNFIIILLDTVDSRSFYRGITNNKEFKNTFNDFSYYPDTMSGHTYTWESLPLILTGSFYQNDEPIREYSTKAYKDSYLFKSLRDKGYDLNVYSSLLYDDISALNISNFIDVTAYNTGGIIAQFAKQELKYTLYKYLPYFLKKYSSIETLSWNIDVDNVKNQSYDMGVFNDYINKNDKIVDSDKKVFKFIHLEGGHYPFHYNKKLENYDGNYQDMIEASLTLTNNYLNYLKKNEVYDNSVIVVMADHGYDLEGGDIGRQNPILFIKGINEHHSAMITSSKPISFVDLKNGFAGLIDNNKSTELFKDVTDNRTRRFLWYHWESSRHMVEYETKGKAWETDKMYKTGKVFEQK